MKFKDQLDKDIEEIFLNLDEFAEEINLDGKNYTGILIEPDKGNPKTEYEGISSCVNYIAHLKYDKSLEKYSTGKQVELNRYVMNIHRSYKEGNLFTIEFEERSPF